MIFPDKRASFLKSAALLVASQLLAAGITSESLAQEEPRKALFVYGGWKGHAPEKYRDMVVPWLKSEGFEVTVTDTLEHYMHVDPNNKVLAATTFNADHDYWVKGATMPVAWKKVYGKGRVFYTSLGHQPAVFESPEALTMLHRGILWAARSKYEETPDLVRPMYPSALPDK
ncbi:MAG: ThuA domain-containing protein [Steroidobacteraceae bacterium]